MLPERYGALLKRIRDKKNDFTKLKLAFVYYGDGK